MTTLVRPVHHFALPVLLSAALLAALPPPAAASAPPDSDEAPVLQSASAAELPGPTGSVNGVLPIWEQTAILHRGGGGQVGYGHAQLGLGRVQLGTQPFLDLHGTLNLQVKLALLRRGAHHTALVLGAYRLPAAAEGRTLGELHRSGFTNPYGPLRLFPVAVAHSWAVAERLDIHSTLTTLFRHAEDPAQRRTSVGAATMIEARASRRWSARLHAGYWGVGVEPQAHLGLSFAYPGRAPDARRRVRPPGVAHG